MTTAGILVLLIGVALLVWGEHADRSAIHFIPADGRAHTIHLRAGTYDIDTDENGGLAGSDVNVFDVRTGGHRVPVTQGDYAYSAADVGLELAGVGSYSSNGFFRVATHEEVQVAVPGDTDGDTESIVVAPSGQNLAGPVLPPALVVAVGLALLLAATIRR